MLLIETLLDAATPPALDALRLSLPFEARVRSRLRITLDNGEPAGLFLPRGTILRQGDRLLAADGRQVEVHSAPEPLVEAQASDPRLLARAAYHLGNRHVAVEVGPGWLRFARDSVLEAMVAGLGLQVRACECPFEPEAGAYGSAHTHGAPGLPGTPRIHDHFAGT